MSDWVPVGFDLSRFWLVVVALTGCAVSTCPQIDEDGASLVDGDAGDDAGSDCSSNAGRLFLGPTRACPSDGTAFSVVVYNDDLRVALARVPVRCAFGGSSFFDVGSLPAGHYLVALDSIYGPVRGMELLDPEQCRGADITFPGPYMRCVPMEADVRPCAVSVVMP